MAMSKAEGETEQMPGRQSPSQNVLLYGKEKSMKRTKKAFIAVSMIGFAAMMFSCAGAKTTAAR